MEAAQRGQLLTDHAVESATGQPVRRLDASIRKWFFRQRGIVLRHFSGDDDREAGYYLLTNTEQARQPQRRVRQARRRYAFGVYEGTAVDQAELDDADRNILQRHIRIAAAQLQLATEAVSRVRWTLEGRKTKSLTGAEQA